MLRAARFFAALVVGLTLAGCEDRAVTMSGNARGVLINYVGDVAQTLPLARKHCGQYEREPVLRSAKDNTAAYDCVRANGLP